ncbi:hypothetical protein [Rheinheimera sp. MM224]|uniref:hypothetical protein n=1 Tax=Rheinheimera sp. MM224 TaxID=3019969 RepID=UPI0021F8BDDF|nr:hypothetical protein [Rheinheimera sp. MM224]CAI3798938.1 hypothetical protein JAMGFMIE_02200 [Rheinheimera sp. MM224]
MKKTLTLSLLVLSLTGCATVPADKDNLATQLDGPLAQLQLDTRQLQLRLERLTENKECQQDNQCKVIGVGARPCGGPDQYLLYSTLHTDEKMLSYTNDRYQKLKKQQNEKLGLMSTCQMLMPPVSACIENKCALGNATR